VPFTAAGRAALPVTPRKGIPWIEQGIRAFRATGSLLTMPRWLALQAEALHLANRTSDALEAIKEGEDATTFLHK
jgi:hypothetical protein